ncbi:S24 family peptidase [Sodalis sp. RH24]|uniref:HumD family translesion DNA polymerase n=1 Tax=unclassified Sodalis (in: enterobacteria) TaxID=2636512 RepID=UPI0039B6CCEA
MGFPSPAQDYIEASLSLDELCISHKSATFFMRAGESSVRHGIYKGAVLVVDRSITPVDGTIIVVEMDGGFRLRRYKTYPARGLEQLDYPGRLERFDEEEGIVCFGVVTYVLNDMRTGEFDDNPVI